MSGGCWHVPACSVCSLLPFPRFRVREIYVLHISPPRRRAASPFLRAANYNLHPCSDGELHAPTLQQHCRPTLQIAEDLLQNNLKLGQYSSFVWIFGSILLYPILKFFSSFPLNCLCCMLQVVVDQCEPWSGRKIDLQIDPVYLPCTEEARALIQVSSHWSRLTILACDWSRADNTLL